MKLQPCKCGGRGYRTSEPEMFPDKLSGDLIDGHYVYCRSCDRVTSVFDSAAMAVIAWNGNIVYLVAGSGDAE